MAAELRRLRKAAGITLEEAAHHLDVTHSTLSRVETGHAGIRPPYVESLLRLYGVDEAERDALIKLAREARQRGWWQAYSDVLSADYSSYVGFETEATSIHTYEPQTIPGLLQTEPYARALTRAQEPDFSPDEVEPRVKLRMERQARLDGEDSVRFWAILGEAALRYEVGGPEVMREQLERLLDAAEPPNVTIQVLPFAIGAHPGMFGPFVVLSFADFPDTVYMEHLTRSLYLEEEEEIERYRLVFEHLRAVAVSPEESRKMITRTLREVKRTPT